MADRREMFRTMDRPFAGDEFPAALGATVQRTVLDGELPALIVGHFPSDGWHIGDGINDPNLPGAAIATHIVRLSSGRRRGDGDAGVAEWQTQPA